MSSQACLACCPSPCLSLTITIFSDSERQGRAKASDRGQCLVQTEGSADDQLPISPFPSRTKGDHRSSPQAAESLTSSRQTPDPAPMMPSRTLSERSPASPRPLRGTRQANIPSRVQSHAPLVLGQRTARVYGWASPCVFLPCASLPPPPPPRCSCPGLTP